MKDKHKYSCGDNEYYKKYILEYKLKYHRQFSQYLAEWDSVPKVEPKKQSIKENAVVFYSIPKD